METFLVPAGVAAALGWAFWTYLRREPPVGGRVLLASLRAATLVLLVLLLWNPPVPLGAGDDGRRAPGILVDASLSMTAADTAGEDPWSGAVRSVGDEPRQEEPMLLFGSGVRTTGADGLPDDPPGDAASRLAPALERAAELGADSVRVISDFRLEDPVAAAAIVEETGLVVRYEDVGGTVRNAALAGVDAPATAEAGDTVEASVLLGGEGGGPADSVDLELRRDGRLLEARRVPLPAERRTVRHRLEFTASATEGADRLTVRAELAGDAFDADDERVLFLDVEPARTGVVLLSLRPDWEPRYLLPVLEQVSGIDGSGFFRLPDGRWAPMGAEADREEPLDEARIRELVGDATLLVLHGAGTGAPGWVAEAAGAADRLLLFPADRQGAAAADVSAGAWREEEWYPDPDLPPSPLAGELSGLDLEGLPPLTRLLALQEEPGGTVPLRVRRGGSGAGEPAIVLLSDAGGRRALVLASGFWRWGARGGPPREAYRRVWSGISGWLLARPVETDEPVVEPVERPAPRGSPVQWRLRGEVGDTVSIRVAAADSAAVDTTFVDPGGTLRTRALEPGRYRYDVRAAGLPGGAAEGELEVSGHSAEVLRPRVTPPGARVATGEAGRGLAAGPTRRLRTHPAPYLLILLLLSVEWIGRRRQGLR